MQRRKLIAQILETQDPKTHRQLFETNSSIVNLKLAEDLKNTYYESWTNHPFKIRNAANALKVLAEILSQKEIKAFAKWVEGIAFLTESKIQKAIDSLDKASKIFLKLQKPYNSAETQVSKLYALALLGKYEEAIEAGEKALRIFEEFNDQLAAGKVEINLSNIVSRQEFHQQAEKYCLSACRRFQKLKEFNWLTMAENDLANTYMELNNFRLAEKFYGKSLRRAKKNKMFVTAAEIEASMGKLSLFRGKFDSALRYLEISRQKYETLKMPHQTATAKLETADAYLELNLIKEALTIYQEIAETFKELEMTSEEAKARMNLGRTAFQLGMKEISQREFEKSAELFRLEKNFIGENLVKIYQAQINLIDKDYQNVYLLACQAEKLFSERKIVRYQLIAKLLIAESLRGLERFEAAENIYQEALKEAEQQENPLMAQSCKIALGKLALAIGNRQTAENHFLKAIELIETVRSPLPAEEFRMSFLADKLVAFEQLAGIYLQANQLEKAFLLIEKARSRTLLESLNNSQQNKSSKKLQDLREELNWFYSRLNRAKQSEIEDLQTQAKNVEQKINELLRQLNSTRKKDFQETLEIDLIDLHQNLGNDVCLLEYFSFDGKICVFVVQNGQIEFFENLITESEVMNLLEKVHFQFGVLRYGLDNVGDFLEELKKKTDFYLQKLFEKLLPFAEKFGNKKLVIIPYRELHYIPFHALFDGKSYLIEKNTVSYSPSAGVLQRSLEKKNVDNKKALLVGFADEKTPFVEDEIKVLGEILPNNISLTGKKAKFRAFQKYAESVEIIHLACHGNFRADNSMFSSLRLSDGWITVRDVCSLNLKADLVTLSACETGLNEIFAGDEILGLARGFLTAGANSLLLTLWTVNDEAAIKLMQAFYQNLNAGNSPAEALQKSQISFIKKNSHPYFWSPFALSGKF